MKFVIIPTQILKVNYLAFGGLWWQNLKMTIVLLVKGWTELYMNKQQCTIKNLHLYKKIIDTISYFEFHVYKPFLHKTWLQNYL